MYCSKCGKENLEGARFCMHCGADLSGYKMEISPKIEVSPKISVSAKAEGVPYPKWKPKPKWKAKIKGMGSLPVYEDFPKSEHGIFCPECGNMNSLKYDGKCSGMKDQVIYGYERYHCQACGKQVLKIDESFNPIEPTPTDTLVVGEVRLVEWASTIKNEENYSISFAENYKLRPDTTFKLQVYPKYFFSGYQLCPICGEKGLLREDTRLVCSFHKRRYSHTGGPSHDYGGIYKLYNCSNCQKQFLVFHKEADLPDKRLGLLWGISTKSLCGFCKEAVTIHKCSKCGKIICEHCKVKVKTGIFSREIRCPDCAKEK